MTELLILFIACFAVTLVMVWSGIHYLKRREVIFDIPDDEAGRGIPVPRSGGLAVMPVIFAGISVLYAQGMLLFPQPLCWLIILGSGVALAAMSWVDDKRKDGLAARYRFTIQFLAILFPLMMLPPEWRVMTFDQMPLYAERIIIGVLWMWFCNAYNFMDGINGITAVETMSITLGIVVLTLVSGMGLENGMLELNMMIAGAAAGFFFWNGRGKARAFMGDIGTVGLGYQLGWILLLLAVQGYTAVAVILPMIYILDSSFTVIRRLLEGKKIWKNHRDHLYQRAVHDTGLSHMQVTSMIAVTNIVLIVIAMNVVQNILTPWNGVFCAMAVVTLLLGIFYKIGKRAL